MGNADSTIAVLIRHTQVNASAIFEFPFYTPNASGARITCPLKLIAATQDNLCPHENVLELARLSSLVEVVPLECGTHHIMSARRMPTLTPPCVLMQVISSCTPARACLSSLWSL